MPADLARIKDLFLAVLDMPGAERAAYLDAACAGDTALRQQIEAMLLSHENSGELLRGSPEELLDNGGATEADATAAFAQHARPSATQTEPAHAAPDDLAFLAPSAEGHLGRLGHYEVREVIGKGGFGVVLKGFDERLHRVVAIKVLSPAYAANGSARQRFIREARAAAAVKNEHVVGIYDVEDDAQPPYFVMEMIDGESLQAKLDRSGSLGVKEILRIGMQIAEGLAVAHKQGLVHRDIKPANILLDNGVERVKLTDFGLARAVDDASITQSGTVAGTPMYMSPEQAEGLPIDHRSDLFSLGTVLYTMCTGRTPFRASGTHAVLKRVIDASPRPIREINNEIPDWLCDTIARLHAKRPEDRFQTAGEVAEVLGQQLAHLQLPMTVPMPAVSAPAVRSAEAHSDEREATFPVRLMPRDIVDVMLAGLLVPVVIAIFWVPPVATVAWLTSLTGLGTLSVVAGLVVGTVFFIGVFFVVGLDAQRAVVSRRGIELVRDAGAPTLIRWRDLRRVAEATRWEVFRRVWLWPGLPPRGSIMGMSALHHFRIEWQGSCYYFAPADPAAFAQAVAFYRSQAASDLVATAAETDSASRVEAG
jgi:hypothetical protein